MVIEEKWGLYISHNAMSGTEVMVPGMVLKDWKAFRDEFSLIAWAEKQFGRSA